MIKTLKNSGKIYCVGIGGAGLSALAAILKQSGKDVSGSDAESSARTKKLETYKIHVDIGHKTTNLPPKTDILIYSPAIKKNNPERIQAGKLKIRQLSYPKAAGELTQEKNTVAVCGTHGKTTVTSMISAVFIRSGKDPSVIVGSHISELENENFRLGKGDTLIIEACEYCRNFLHYHPDTILINNIEADHLDYFTDEKDYIEAFMEFAFILPKQGLLVANTDCKNTALLVKSVAKKRPDLKIVTFGLKSGDFQYKDNTIFHHGKKTARLNLKIPGQHNLLNAIGAAALSICMSIKPKSAAAALNQYKGAARRFELKGKIGKTSIYDDYAHHPTEIKATIDAAREKFGHSARILTIFQPHQHSRTFKLKDEFAKSFKKADKVIVSDIFQTRDTKKDIVAIDSPKLTRLIDSVSKNAIYGGNLQETTVKAKSLSSDYDVIIIMGAGNIDEITQNLLTNK